MAKKNSIPRITPPRVVYLARAEDVAWKVGRAAVSKFRIEMMQPSCPFLITLEHEIVTPYAVWFERQLLKKYRAKRIRGEWFALSDEDVEEIRKIDGATVELLWQQHLTGQSATA